MNNKVLDSKFNLLKIIAMFLIVCWHIIIHCNFLGRMGNENISQIFTIFLMTIIMHVNVFVMVTGYYQYKKKMKLKKALNIYLVTMFYIIACFIVAYFLGLVKIDFITIFNIVEPMSLNNYWFVVCYLILYLLSDFLNIFIKNASKKTLNSFLIIGFILFSVVPFLSGNNLISNTGYTFYHFIYMYIVGAYLAKYPLKNNKQLKKLSLKQYRIALVVLFILTVGINYLLVDNFNASVNYDNVLLDTLAYRLNATIYTYARPFVIIQSVLFFEFFNTLNVKSRVINFLAGSALGIYLITDNYLIKNKIFEALNLTDSLIFEYGFILKFIVCSLIIFIAALLIDIIRRETGKLIYLLWGKIKQIKPKT